MDGGKIWWWGVCHKGATLEGMNAPKYFGAKREREFANSNSASKLKKFRVFGVFDMQGGGRKHARGLIGRRMEIPQYIVVVVLCYENGI